MSTHVITVNDREILILNEGGEKFVAIRPICKAIGIDYKSQIDKIKADEILGQLRGLSTSTGADGKEYKMVTLPLKYIFGWLFTISPKNVNPEVKDSIIEYRKMCYDALFNAFTKRTAILKEKTDYQIEIEKLEKELSEDDRYIKIQDLKKNVKATTQRLNTLDKNVINEQLDLFKKQ